MDGLKLDDQRDFVARQYANLLARGLDEASARARLNEVLGAAAVMSLDSGSPDAGVGIGHRVIDAVRCAGGSAAVAQAEIVRSLAEARLLALDWWRPIRTFLLYILFLLGLAAVISIIYVLFVLPAFTQLDQTLGVRGGKSGWLPSSGAIRLLAPWVVMAVTFALLATRWAGMRQRMARLAPLARRVHGGAGSAFEVLRCLEFAAAIKAAGVADASVLDIALHAADWPAGKPLHAGAAALADHLKQAVSLGTFGEELEWQRRVHWSTTQAQLELSRDRLILFARVLFYILIGSMVTMLYLPIFSMASMIGVQ